MGSRRISAILVTALLTLLVCSGTVRAQKIKIGYVDLKRAIEETEEGQKGKARLREIFKKKQAELKKKEEELKKKKEEYDSQRLIMPPESRAKAEQELQRGFVELQTALMGHQKELAHEEAGVMKKILEKMERILHEIGRGQGYTMILEKSEGRILYALPSLDLTNEVIRRYNEMK